MRADTAAVIVIRLPRGTVAFGACVSDRARDLLMGDGPEVVVEWHGERRRLVPAPRPAALR